MLAYGLAILVAIGSLLLYAIALRFPLLSRRSDLLWSGVGLFYALVLWVCGEQFAGALLLAQGAAVALLGWLLWQLLVLRVQMARSLDPINSAGLPDFSGWLAWAEVFRPADPSLSGWQAVQQSLMGFGLLVWMQVRSGQWRLPVAWPWAIGQSPAAPATPPAPPTASVATTQPTATAPASGPMPAPPVAADPNVPKPVYVRKKYRQPDSEAAPETAAPPSPSPSPAPAAPVTPPIAGGESKPVYVRKKYRQPDAEGTPPVSSPPAPPSPAPAVPAAPPPTSGESKPVYVRKKYRQPDTTDAAAAPSPSPAPEPDRPAPPRDRPKPPSTIQLDGAKLPDEVVVDYEELPPRPPAPRRRPDRPR